MTMNEMTTLKAVGSYVKQRVKETDLRTLDRRLKGIRAVKSRDRDMLAIYFSWEGMYQLHLTGIATTGYHLEVRPMTGRLRCLRLTGSGRYDDGTTPTNEVELAYPNAFEHVWHQVLYHIKAQPPTY